MPTLPAPDFLTANEQASIKADVNSLVADTQAGAISVTYRKLTLTSGSATYNPASGAITDPYTSVTLNALVVTCRESDAKMAGMELEATDRKILVDSDDVGRQPSSGDVVVIASQSYEVMWVRAQAGTTVSVVYLKLSGVEV